MPLPKECHCSDSVYVKYSIQKNSTSYCSLDHSLIRESHIKDLSARLININRFKGQRLGYRIMGKISHISLKKLYFGLV